MADASDRFDLEDGVNGHFIMGLLTGTVLGAGLGLLFAPKSGARLRTQLSEQASTLANSASEAYRRATETAGDLGERGRETFDAARDTISRDTTETARHLHTATRDMSGSGPSTASGGDSWAPPGSLQRR